MNTPRFSLKSLLIGTTLVAFALLAYLSIGSIDETKRRGDVIVQALNKYRVDHSQFPAALADLSPKYLANIPEPKWGLRVWKYHRTNAGEFYLGVDESVRTGDGDSLWFQYLGRRDGWQTGD